MDGERHGDEGRLGNCFWLKFFTLKEWRDEAAGIHRKTKDLKDLCGSKEVLTEQNSLLLPPIDGEESQDMKSGWDKKKKS